MKNYINMGLVVFEYENSIKNDQNLQLSKAISNYIRSRSKDDIPKHILVSLKLTTCSDNYENLALFVKTLNLISKKNDLDIAIINYDDKKYELLRKLCKSTFLKLFRTFDIARLFFRPDSFKKDSCILINDTDGENANKLSNRLSMYGKFNISVNDTPQPEKLPDFKKYQIIVNRSSLNLEPEQAVNSKQLDLSKKLINILPLFMESAVDSLETVTALEAQKSSHCVGSLSNDIKNKDNIFSIMKFRGDLVGSFTLAFPKENALMALEALLQEKINENDIEALKDGIGELCNIVIGSTKSALSKQNINILFETPLTYTNLKQTLNEIGEENGILINMLLAGKPFFMFIKK